MYGGQIMSWSISKLYRNAAEVQTLVGAEPLPNSILVYIKTAAAELEKLTQSESEAPAILVHGHGHLCHEGPGGGNYEVTSAKLVVLPLRFGKTLSLPLAVT